MSIRLLIICGVSFVASQTYLSTFGATDCIFYLVDLVFLSDKRRFVDFLL